MPKKLGVNSKAVEAKARKDEKKRADQDRQAREKEDALWADDDKQVQRKQNRRDEREKKAKEQADRKATNKALYENEMGPDASTKSASAAKITRAQITANVERQRELEQRELEKSRPKAVNEQPIEENLNRLQLEGEVASTVDEAIHVLGNKPAEIDMHPERRLKASYAAFEEANLPRLKAENPNLRLSQLKQMLKKDWTKSPENPLNQALLNLSKK